MRPAARSKRARRAACLNRQFSARVRTCAGALSGSPNALFYLCGPQGMVEDMSSLLKDLGVPASRVIFEKCW